MKKNSIMESKWLFFSWLNLFKKIVSWSTSETSFLNRIDWSFFYVSRGPYRISSYICFEFKEETIFKHTCVLSTNKQVVPIFSDFCDVIFFQRYMVTQPFPKHVVACQPVRWVSMPTRRNFDIAMQHLQAAPFGSSKLGVDHEKTPRCSKYL